MSPLCLLPLFDSLANCIYLCTVSSFEKKVMFITWGISSQPWNLLEEKQGSLVTVGAPGQVWLSHTYKASFSTCAEVHALHKNTDHQCFAMLPPPENMCPAQSDYTNSITWNRQNCIHLEQEKASSYMLPSHQVTQNNQQLPTSSCCSIPEQQSLGCKNGMDTRQLDTRHLSICPY